MPTPSDRCIARAEEAERLAALVSYARDRERLTRQAREWRDRAAELAARPEPEPPTAGPSFIGLLLQRLRGRTTTA